MKGPESSGPFLEIRSTYERLHAPKDRPGQVSGSWLDAQDRHRQRKLAAHTLEQARRILNLLTPPAPEPKKSNANPNGIRYLCVIEGSGRGLYAYKFYGMLAFPRDLNP